MEKLRIERTKSGLPALWEAGGGATNTGESTIICDRFGCRKKPVYVKRSGHLSNGRHALIVLEIGDHIVEAEHHRKDFRIQVYRVLDFEEETANAELVYEFSRNEWNHNPPDYLQPAIQASIEKASCYHCREPHYVSS